MIVFKNSELTNNTINVLNNLLDLEIKSVAAFKLARIVKQLSSIIEDKNKAEKKIYDKWVLFDEQGNPVPVKDENGNIISSLFAPEQTSESMLKILGY